MLSAVVVAVVIVVLVARVAWCCLEISCVVDVVVVLVLCIALVRVLVFCVVVCVQTFHSSFLFPSGKILTFLFTYAPRLFCTQGQTTCLVNVMETLWREILQVTGSNREKGAGPPGQGAVHGEHRRAGLQSIGLGGAVVHVLVSESRGSWFET